jgi:hypothetical protein
VHLIHYAMALILELLNEDYVYKVWNDCSWKFFVQIGSRRKCQIWQDLQSEG